jgi:hypothetical protein
MKRNLMIAALAFSLTSGAACNERSGLVLGDWRLNSELIGLNGEKDGGFTLNAETAWNYSDRNRGVSNCSILKGDCYKLGLYVNCKANQFNLTTVTICKTCADKNIDLSVSVDGVRRFALKAVDADFGHRQSDDLGGSTVRAPLTLEQVATLSKSKTSILVEMTDRAPIYIEPKKGTALAFATLATACAKE